MSGVWWWGGEGRKREGGGGEGAAGNLGKHLWGVKCPGHVLFVGEHQQDGILQVLLLQGWAAREWRNERRSKGRERTKNCKAAPP